MCFKKKKKLKYFSSHCNSTIQGKIWDQQQEVAQKHRQVKHLPTKSCSDLAALPEVGINPSKIVRHKGQTGEGGGDDNKENLLF